MSYPCTGCSVAQVSLKDQVCSKCAKSGVKPPSIKGMRVDKEGGDPKALLVKQMELLRGHQRLIKREMSDDMSPNDYKLLSRSLADLSRAVALITKEWLSFEKHGEDILAKMDVEDQKEVIYSFLIDGMRWGDRDGFLQRILEAHMDDKPKRRPSAKPC